MDASDQPLDDRLPPRRPLWRRLGPVLLLLALVAAAFAGGVHRLLSFDALVAHAGALQGFVAGNGPVAAAAYVAVYAALVAMSLPGALVATLTGGFLFGGLLGGALAVVAATTGATVVFLIARTAIGDALVARARGAIARLADGFREDAFSYLLFLRLAPVFPFFVVNLAPAALGVRLKTFVAATALGIVPGTFAFAFVGAGLGGVVAQEAERRGACLARGGADCAARLDPSTLVSTPILLALGGLAVVALLPVAAKRLRRRKGPAA
ncbi:TVP38/TMEM64 family protein [Methylopila sp. Yamaguchi]|uniref:TVP38/TMEM64 family protein n=1 Tax=Methylopila sp. Yamaguchi TaxID=1437817 RepID=UPI000CB7AE31|nr:VTT domain-containing protein [Methylopila sp. Yamaguchi]GBD50349.1 hypothetical protein METY_3562 [Methylopila sp. Yamaguchi]